MLTKKRWHRLANVRMIGICHGFDLSGHLHTCPPWCKKKRKGRYSQSMALKVYPKLCSFLNRLSVTSGCPDTSYSKRRQLFTFRFQPSVESKALAVVHAEGFWQVAMVRFFRGSWAAEMERGGKCGVERVALWRGPGCKNTYRDCARGIITQRSVKGLSCSTALKGPWWYDTSPGWWMWLLALVIDSPVLFDSGRLSSTGSELNGGLAFERKPTDLLAD